MPDGSIQKYLVEIKPKKQLSPPKEPKRRTQSYLNEMMEYAKNQSKWEYAREWCEDRQYGFKILTEIELNIKY
jgi:ATP:corrinoid adenosyltransferase